MLKRVSSARPRSQQKPARRSGLAVLEFAMVTPILLLLVLGVAEIAQAIFVTESLTGAASQGAQMGARTSATEVEIQSLVKQIVSRELTISQDAVLVEVSYAPLAVDLTQDDLCHVAVSTEAGLVGLGFSRMFTDARLHAYAAQRCTTAE